MLKYLLFICLFCLQANSMLAQREQDSTQVTSPPLQVDDQNYHGDLEDTAQDIYVDTFIYAHEISLNKDSILYWKNQRQFAYMKNLDSLLKASQVNTKQPEYKPSFIERLLRSNLFSVLAWMICAFVIVLIAYQLIKNNGIFSGNRNSKKLVEEYTPEEQAELIQDFDQMIQQACGEGDFRMAVRYEFLKTLKILRNNGYIEYAIDKTNTLYLTEVPLNWRTDFKSLIHDYEYVWYGNFLIDEDQYLIIQKKFASLTRLMQ